MAINPDAHPLKNLLPHDDPELLGSFDPNQNAYSAGADCSGFVCEAAEYAGNPYQFGRVSTQQLATTCWLISEGTARANEQPTGLDLVVPGDILVLSGVHVAIVQSVTCGVDGRVTRDCIKLINSAAGPTEEEYRVLTDLIWNGASGLRPDEYFLYQVMRLRVRP